VRQRDDNSTTTAMTSTAVAQGTPMYMAPELLAGDDASQITKKVDVFAFSIICWEMMHRASPYPQTWSVLTLFRRVEAGDRCVVLLLQPRARRLTNPPPRRRPPLDDGRCPQGSHMRRVIEQSWAGSPHERPNFKALIEILKTRGATGRTLDVKPVAGHWVASTNTTQPLLPSLLVTQAPEYPALHSIVTVLMTRADGMAEHCRGEVLEVNEAEGCVSVQLLPEPSADELLLNPMAEEDEASTVFNPLADGLESKTSGWSRMSITGPPQVVSVRPAQIIKPDQTLSGLAIAHVRRQVQASRSVLGGNQISLPGTQAPQGLRLVIDTGGLPGGGGICHRREAAGLERG
jgi:serine/threonine protein kinase